MKLGFSWQIFKKYSNIQFHPEGAELSHSDRHTDMTKLTLALWYFVHTHLKKVTEGCGMFNRYEAWTQKTCTGKQWDWKILEIDCNSILQLELRYKIFKKDHIREWLPPVAHGSQECIVSIATPYGLDGVRLKPQLQRYFLHPPRLALRPTQVPCTMGNGFPSQG
jgi:hypothetical protein